MEINITSKNGASLHTANKYCSEDIKVNLQTQDLVVTPSNEEQNFSGLFDNITVSGDENLIPENIKSGVSIFGVNGTHEGGSNNDNNATLDATGITTLTIASMVVSVSGKLDTSSATDINSLFNNATKLKNVPLFDTSKVTNMNMMFNNCYVLETVPHFDTSSATHMNYMFGNCRALKIVPQFNTSKLTMMNNAFNGCRALTEEGLNNILGMCATTTSNYTATKTLKQLGLNSAQATTCQSLSNYQAFLDARLDYRFLSYLQIDNFLI